MDLFSHQRFCVLCEYSISTLAFLFRQSIPKSWRCRILDPTLKQLAMAPTNIRRSARVAVPEKVVPVKKVREHKPFRKTPPDDSHLQQENWRCGKTADQIVVLENLWTKWRPNMRQNTTKRYVMKENVLLRNIRRQENRDNAQLVTALPAITCVKQAKAFITDVCAMARTNYAAAKYVISNRVKLFVDITGGQVYKSTARSVTPSENSPDMGIGTSIPPGESNYVTVTGTFHLPQDKYRARVTVDGVTLFSARKSTLPNAGFGVFAEMDFKKGDVLGLYCGKEILSPNRRNDKSHFTIVTRGGRTVEPSRSKSFMMLHLANDPNCGVCDGDSDFDNEAPCYNIRIGNNMVVTAIKKIEKGEELFICYHIAK
jgi:hypothetical protein